MSVNLTILNKRLAQTGTAAPATRPVAALLPEEWHEQLKHTCAAMYTTPAAYLRELVRQDLHKAGLIRDHRHD